MINWTGALIETLNTMAQKRHLLFSYVCLSVAVSKNHFGVGAAKIKLFNKVRDSRARHFWETRVPF